jgi:pimeloyl-ACP methyl ester carboxylesterase
MAFFLRVMLFFIKVGMLFVPQDKYAEKIRAIPDMDAKNAGTDLKGWEYRKLLSPDGFFVHRYYYYPSSKPDAPVFLFFHGLNLDGRTFMNLRGLADQWQLVAYDLPEQAGRYQGHFEDFMDIVNEFIELMDIRTCCLCGVSFGGSIALRLAASHPEIDAQRLVLASTAIIGVSKSEKRERRRMAAWVEKQPDYKLYWFMEKVFERSARQYDDPDTGRTVLEILRVKHPSFYRQVGVSMGDYDAGVDARKVKCPVLWLMGDKDNLFSDRQIRRIKEYVPQAEFEVVKGGTHAMVLTRGEEIAGRIRSFCVRHCPVERTSE